MAVLVFCNYSDLLIFDFVDKWLIDVVWEIVLSDFACGAAMCQHFI